LLLELIVNGILLAILNLRSTEALNKLVLEHRHVSSWSHHGVLLWAEKTAQGEYVRVDCLWVDCRRIHRVGHRRGDVVVIVLFVLFEGGEAVRSVTEVAGAAHAASTTQDLTGALAKLVRVLVTVGEVNSWLQVRANVLVLGVKLLWTDELFLVFIWSGFPVLRLW